MYYPSRLPGLSYGADAYAWPMMETGEMEGGLLRQALCGNDVHEQLLDSMLKLTVEPWRWRSRYIWSAYLSDYRADVGEPVNRHNKIVIEGKLACVERDGSLLDYCWREKEDARGNSCNGAIDRLYA